MEEPKPREESITPVDSYDIMKSLNSQTESTKSQPIMHDDVVPSGSGVSQCPPPGLMDPQGSSQGTIPKMVMAQKPPTIAELRKRFFYHPPRDQQAIQNHEAVSQRTFELACSLVEICPPGRNLSLALTALEEVRMRANAAIAVDDPRD